MMKNDLRLSRLEHFWLGEFVAMASPCEVLVETRSKALARRMCKQAFTEALRIEAKFSRYRDDSVVQKINHSAGAAVDVDEETARLLDFSAQCFDLSEGLFDITSGVLRRAWNFQDRAGSVPSQKTLDSLLEHIGWQKLNWKSPTIQMPVGMQIDFGGIGKEYAVDAVTRILNSMSEVPFLVNFGGDLHASRAPRQVEAWDIGIRLAGMRSASVAQNSTSTPSTETADVAHAIHLQRGAMATSGDAERFLMSLGVRYGHILNPKTGWPSPGGPRSVTVAGDSCTEAGVLSTLAMLKGRHAKTFLDEQEAVYWCQW